MANYRTLELIAVIRRVDSIVLGKNKVWQLPKVTYDLNGKSIEEILRDNLWMMVLSNGLEKQIGIKPIYSGNILGRNPDVDKFMVWCEGNSGKFMGGNLLPGEGLKEINYFPANEVPKICDESVSVYWPESVWDYFEDQVQNRGF